MSEAPAFELPTRHKILPRCPKCPPIGRPCKPCWNARRRELHAQHNGPSTKLTRERCAECPPTGDPCRPCMNKHREKLATHNTAKNPGWRQMVRDQFNAAQARRRAKAKQDAAEAKKNGRPVTEAHLRCDDCSTAATQCRLCYNAQRAERRKTLLEQGVNAPRPKAAPTPRSAKPGPSRAQKRPVLTPEQREARAREAAEAKALKAAQTEALKAARKAQQQREEAAAVGGLMAEIARETRHRRCGVCQMLGAAPNGYCRRHQEHAERSA